MFGMDMVSGKYSLAWKCHPLWSGGFFSLEILYPDQQKISSESLTKGQNDHFHLFFIREEPSLTEGPNVVH